MFIIRFIMLEITISPPLMVTDTQDFKNLAVFMFCDPICAETWKTKQTKQKTKSFKHFKQSLAMYRATAQSPLPPHLNELQLCNSTPVWWTIKICGLALIVMFRAKVRKHKFNIFGSSFVQRRIRYKQGPRSVSLNDRIEQNRLD